MIRIRGDHAPQKTVRPEYYILVGQTPVPVEPCDPYTPEGRKGLLEWGRWFEHADRHVARTVLSLGLCEVSTIFLGLDHNYAFTPNDPILFETMAFWRPCASSSHQVRCSSWLEAEQQHAAIVRECQRLRVIIACLASALGEWLHCRRMALGLWLARLVRKIL